VQEYGRSARASDRRTWHRPDGKKDAKASTTPMPEDAEHHDDVEDAAA
jgi:hypothetical protein